MTAGGTTRSFTWDEAQGPPTLLVDATSSSTTYFVYGAGAMPLEQIDSSGAVLYFHHDQLGSTRVLTDQTGTVVASFTFDSYGSLTASTGTAATPFLYAGQYRDSATGLYYLRARYYDPTTASFLSRDPAASKTGQPYAYGVDNPLNMVDPTGLDSWGKDTGMCANPADRTSNIPCGDAREFYYSCSGGTQHDQLNCEAENYYDEYFRAYTMLQNIYQQGTASRMDSKCLNGLVAHELHGIWGDIYVDNTKSKVLPGVHESPADEDKVHLFGPLDYPGNAPGVHANGTVDFYNQAGPHPLTLSDFKDVNG